VFSRLNEHWQGIVALAQQTGLSQRRVTQALKKLSQANLAMGAENAWLRHRSLEQIEEVRWRLLHALNEPMMVNDWTQSFQTDRNAAEIKSAIALLVQEGLIAYDSKTGQYQRLVQEGQEERTNNDRKVALAEIRIDGGTQPRTELNEDVIAEYAELLQEGAEFPAITVYFDGANYWLADGFHRYWAAKRVNAELNINVIDGSKRDAILHSVGANANHGLRRSNEDKRKAVTTLLQDEEWRQWSDRAIARQCQVTQPFVSKLRNQLSDNGYQMKENHTRSLECVLHSGETPELRTRKVKRGEQVYEQLQPAKSPAKVSKQSNFKPMDVEEKSNQPKKSVIPEVHPDVHEAICRFLDLEVEAELNQFYQCEDRAYLIANDNPNDLDLIFERLFSQLEGRKLNSAIAVTPNQAGPQDQIKAKANAVCLVSNSQCLCHRVVWYFGKQRHRFYSMFEPFGIALVFSDGEA
jgi:predicted transcriptional regulator